MKHPSIPDHLYSACAERHDPLCRDAACPEAAKQAPSGRWYITMGHPGFNSRANNDNGYATERHARQDVTFFGGLAKAVNPR